VASTTPQTTSEAAYTYSYDGKRISKYMNGTLYDYTYSGSNLLETYADTAGRIAKYTYGNALISQTNATGSFESVVTDYQNSVIAALTPAPTLFAYDPFGKVRYQSNSDSPQGLGWLGRQFDSETGNHYLINRYYNADRGSFLSPDQYQYVNNATPFTFNLYQYGYANPMTYTDLEGLHGEASVLARVAKEELLQKKLAPYGISLEEYQYAMDHGFSFNKGRFFTEFYIPETEEIPEQLQVLNHQALNGNYWFHTELTFVEGKANITLTPINTQNQQFHVGPEGMNETAVGLWRAFWNPSEYILNEDGSINRTAFTFGLLDVASLSKGAAHLVGGVVTGVFKAILKEVWRTKSLRPLFAASGTAKSDAEALKLLQDEAKVRKAGDVLSQKTNIPARFWPIKRGFLGSTKREFLMPGEQIDRYGGSEFSRFFSPSGTPKVARSLPPGIEWQMLRRFKVLKPFEVESGMVAPAFGHSGLGRQYWSPVRLEILLKRGILEEIR